MSSKKQTHRKAKKRSPKPAIRNLDRLAPQQALSTTLIQRARLDPESLTSGEMLQLQQLVGNRAVDQILDRPSKLKPLPSLDTKTMQAKLQPPTKRRYDDINQAKVFTPSQDLVSKKGKQKTDVKEGKEIQRALSVDNQIDANDVNHVRELKKNTIFLLSGHEGDSLIIKIEILPNNYGDKDEWAKYKGRYEASHELAMGVLDDVGVPNKLVLNDNELAELLILTQILVLDQKEDKDRETLARAIEWHQNATGVMVKMENVGNLVDIRNEIYKLRKERNLKKGDKLKKGSEGEHLKALFSPENIKKLGSVAYYDILTRNWDRFNVERGPKNNIHITEATGEVIALDNINSSPAGSHLSEKGDQWIGELEEMEQFRDKGAIMEYAYMSLDKFASSGMGWAVEGWELKGRKKKKLAKKFTQGFVEARAKASDVVMGWQEEIKISKKFRLDRRAKKRADVIKAKEVIFTRQKIVEGFSPEEVREILMSSLVTY